MIIATLAKLGTNVHAIWMVGAGVLSVCLTAVIVVAGVTMIRRLVNSA